MFGSLLWKTKKLNDHNHKIKVPCGEKEAYTEQKYTVIDEV